MAGNHALWDRCQAPQHHVEQPIAHADGVGARPQLLPQRGTAVGDVVQAELHVDGVGDGGAGGVGQAALVGVAGLQNCAR
ncbi:MAG: hypothetical protein ACE5LU_27870 [Anaerolineae bacterium]